MIIKYGQLKGDRVENNGLTQEGTIRYIPPYRFFSIDKLFDYNSLKY